MQYATQGEDLRIRALESTGRNTQAYFATLSTQYEANMNRMLTAAGMIKDAMEAAAKMVAQMVAGAWSSIHATYGISASASASSSYDVGKNVSDQVQTDNPPLF